MPGLLANYEGNVQLLANGDDFVGWGQQPEMTEFNSHGQPVFEAKFVGDTSSYRAYRFSWMGAPVTKPSVAAQTAGGITTVYASWNGATAVASWRVLAGSSPTQLTAVAAAARKDFETAIRLPQDEQYVAVQALDTNQHVLGSSVTTSVK